MKQILNSLARYGIGERSQTETDFFRICDAENVGIIWSKEKFSFYFNVLGRSFIVLPKRRHGLKLLFAMFHELGHHFMHSGDEPCAMWEGLHHTKNEAEADAIALVALMPISDLENHAFFDDSRYGSHLYNERVRLHFFYRI